MGRQGVQDRPLTDTIGGQEQKQKERSMAIRPTTTSQPAAVPTGNGPAADCRERLRASLTGPAAQQ